MQSAPSFLVNVIFIFYSGFYIPNFNEALLPFVRSSNITYFSILLGLCTKNPSNFEHLFDVLWFVVIVEMG